MLLRFQHNDDILALIIEPDGDGWRITLPDGEERRITAARLPDDIVQITEHPITQLPNHPITQRLFRVPFARTERGVEFSYDGQTVVFTTPTERRAGGTGTRASGALTAPMVGVVAAVLVEEGQAVEAYQPLVVVEAMKVMATMEAPFAGTVVKLHVQKDQRIGHGAPVVDIVPEK